MYTCFDFLYVDTEIMHTAVRFKQDNETPRELWLGSEKGYRNPDLSHDGRTRLTPVFLSATVSYAPPSLGQNPSLDGALCGIETNESTRDLR